jgi:hypothetical protein
MKYKILLLLFLLCCATAVFAQDNTPAPLPIDTASYNKSLEFLQGDGVYESGMMTFLAGLKASIWTHFGLFIGDAQALAAIFMIIFFAIKSYEMMAGDKKMEIMPLLRPFGLARSFCIGGLLYRCWHSRPISWKAKRNRCLIVNRPMSII